MAALMKHQNQTTSLNLLLPSVQVSSNVGSASSATSSTVSDESASNLNSKTATSSNSNNSLNVNDTRSIDSVSSYQLASKLRKIKENLDNCYQSSTNCNIMDLNHQQQQQQKQLQNTNHLFQQNISKNHAINSNNYHHLHHHNQLICNQSSKNNQQPHNIRINIKPSNNNNKNSDNELFQIPIQFEKNLLQAQTLPNNRNQSHDSKNRYQTLNINHHKVGQELPLFIQSVDKNNNSSKSANKMPNNFTPTLTLESISKYVNNCNLFENDLIKKAATKRSSLDNLLDHVVSSSGSASGCSSSCNSSGSGSKPAIPANISILTDNNNKSQNHNEFKSTSINNFKAEYLNQTPINKVNNTNNNNNNKSQQNSNQIRNNYAFELTVPNKNAMNKSTVNLINCSSAMKPSEELLLKQAIFIENVSRQSSIRSLINSAASISNSLNQFNLNNSNISSKTLAKSQSNSILNDLSVNAKVAATVKTKSQLEEEEIKEKLAKYQNRPETSYIYHRPSNEKSKLGKSCDNLANDAFCYADASEECSIQMPAPFKDGSRLSVNENNFQQFNSHNKNFDRLNLSFDRNQELEEDDDDDNDNDDDDDDNDGEDNQQSNTIISNENQNSTLNNNDFSDEDEDEEDEEVAEIIENSNSIGKEEINFQKHLENLSKNFNGNVNHRNNNTNHHDDEEEPSQSILSEFMTNLKFEDLDNPNSVQSLMNSNCYEKTARKATNKKQCADKANSSKPEDCYFQDAESVECNETNDDNESYLLDQDDKLIHPPSYFSNNCSESSQKKQQQIILREKKIAPNHNIQNQPIKYEKYSTITNFNGSRNDRMAGSCSNRLDREKNYQKLSNSINDLFSNLLQQLDKQKRRDYMEINPANKAMTGMTGITNYEINNSSSKTFGSNFSKSIAGSNTSSSTSNCNDLNDLINYNKTFIQLHQQKLQQQPQQPQQQQSIDPSNKTFKSSNRESDFIDYTTKASLNMSNQLLKTYQTYNNPTTYQVKSVQSSASSTANSKSSNPLPVCKKEYLIDPTKAEMSKKKAIAMHTNFVEEIKLVKMNNKNSSTSNSSNSNNNSFFNKNNNNQQNSAELSLLERYLNNEQLISFKHTQVENVLRSYFSKNKLFTNDYSMVEYILNQESISKNTFKQLIKEKFEKFSWTDEILNRLYEIINQPLDSLNCFSASQEANSSSLFQSSSTTNRPRTKLNSIHSSDRMDYENEEDYEENCELNVDEMLEEDDDDLDDEDEVELYENENSTMKTDMKTKEIEVKIFEKEKRINAVIKQLKQSQQLTDLTDSPSSSAKSHRKLKDIKNSLTTKKKHQQMMINAHAQHQFESESAMNLNGLTSNQNVNSINFSELMGPTTASFMNNRFSAANLMNDEETLKQNLSTSFTKRRQRKGSLPEINSNHIIGVDNNNFDLQSSSILSFGNNNTTLNKTLNNTNLNNTVNSLVLNGMETNSLPLSTMNEYFKRRSDKYNSCRSFENELTHSNKHFSCKLDETLMSNSRFNFSTSKKNAFVLEVLRTSMFRSKSLTDLNCTIVKLDNSNNNNTTINGTLNRTHNSRYSTHNRTVNGASNEAHDSLNNTQISIDLAEPCDYTGKKLNATIGSALSPKLNSTAFDTTLCNNSTLNLLNSNTVAENYGGLIWQCADMSYDEFKNKYEELTWLITADKFSSSSKLKEVEQRLKIELNLKEKNMNMLTNLQLNSSPNKTKSSDRVVREKLENQLKVLNDKIKELESMRLFLRICDMNSRGLDQTTLDTFFSVNESITMTTTMTTGENANETSHTITDQEHKTNSLQGKSLLEILKNLYGFDSICNGFIYHFFVTYRYICSSNDLFDFFRTSFLKASENQNTNSKSTLIMDRTIDLIGMWLDGFYTIDFQQNLELAGDMEKLIENEIKIYSSSKSKILINLLYNPSVEFNLFANKQTKYSILINDRKQKKLDQQTKKVNRILNGAIKRKTLVSNLNSYATNGAAAAKLCNRSKSSDIVLNNDDSLSNSHSYYRRDSFSLADHPVCVIASQLTLIEWDNFLDIHVCHCLNSKAQGVNCDSKQPIDPNNISSEQCLFVDNYLSKSVYKMIQFNFMLSHWVSAEILLADNIKNQASMISRFLKIAKKCYEWSNFSTTFSIYEGLQEIAVRNLPAWQYVPTKTMHILEKITSLKLLYQNEPFLMFKISKTTHSPVIPSMHLFLLLVQQNERGSFQLANGQWKWSKFSYLAMLVDQIRVIQQHYSCNFEPFEEFVDELIQRIYSFKETDINHLAENNTSDYQGQKLNISNSSIMNLIPIKKRFN